MKQLKLMSEEPNKVVKSAWIVSWETLVLTPILPLPYPLSLSKGMFEQEYKEAKVKGNIMEALNAMLRKLDSIHGFQTQVPPEARQVM